jgi:hypothetical protein
MELKAYFYINKSGIWTESWYLRSIFISSKHWRSTITFLDFIHRSVFHLKLSKFHLKTETESGFRKAVFKIKDRKMNHVQNCDSFITILCSQPV